MGGKSACMVFCLVCEQFLSVKEIEEERKESKRQSSSDRWIEESRKKAIVRSMSKIDQMQGRANGEIDRASAHERPGLSK